MQKYKIIYIIFLIGLLIFLLYIQAYKIDEYFLALCLIITLIAVFMSFISVGPGMEALSTFLLIFIGIIPVIEELNNVVYWNGNITLNEKIYGDIWIILFEISVIFGYLINKTSKKIKLINFKNNEIKYNMYDVTRIYIYIAIIGLYLLYIFNFDLRLLFTKDDTTPILVDSKGEYLFVQYFLRPLIFNFGLAIFFLSKQSLLTRLIALGIAIFFAFPTGIFRFLVGVLYIPFVYIFFLGKFEDNKIIIQYKKYFISSFLIFSLVFIFPILEIFRGFTEDSYHNLNFGVDYLMTGHYDAFQMFLNALKTDSPNYGYGLLGVLLFFIPRSFWPTKPDDSGREIANLLGLSHNNVSMPIFGELYLNFSYIGIILSGLLLGFIIKRFDLNFKSLQLIPLNIGLLVFFQITGFIVIILRGGLLSEFSFFLSVLFTWIIIYFDKRLFSLR